MYREMQGAESPLFLSYFAQMRTNLGAVETTQGPRPRLFHVKGSTCVH